MFLRVQRNAGVWIASLLFSTVALIANTAGATEALPKCCVWRVTNAKAPFYLVGSVHALDRNDYPLPSPYELALKDAKRLLLRQESIRLGKISVQRLTPSFWRGFERMFHLST